jgi:hypothetical protein
VIKASSTASPKEGAFKEDGEKDFVSFQEILDKLNSSAKVIRHIWEFKKQFGFKVIITLHEFFKSSYQVIGGDCL